jgi:hypothetical protein
VRSAKKNRFPPAKLAPTSTSISSNPASNSRMARTWTTLPLQCRLFLFLSFTITIPLVAGAQLRVLHQEGSLHGFLALSSLEGEVLASGDLIQAVHGNRVTAHLVFHFKDGSLHEETAVYSQHSVFRLLSYHLVQKGPSFPRTLDLQTDIPKGTVRVQYTDKDHPQQIKSEHMDLPLNLANGLTATLFKNIPAQGGETKLSMIVATPKPRLVTLAITSLGEDLFSIAGSKRKATHFVAKVELGGVAGVVAPLVGKKPADINVWVSSGDGPAFLRSENQLFADGPVWRIELTSPTW